MPAGHPKLMACSAASIGQPASTLSDVVKGCGEGLYGAGLAGRQNALLDEVVGLGLGQEVRGALAQGHRAGAEGHVAAVLQHAHKHVRGLGRLRVLQPAAQHLRIMCTCLPRDLVSHRLGQASEVTPLRYGWRDSLQHCLPRMYTAA